MPHEIQLPRLGWSMEEGRFLGWLKRPGERVEEGEPLFSLETDKASQDVDATGSGILCPAPDAPSEGEMVPVGRILGWLLGPGETAPASSPTGPIPWEPAPTSANPAPAVRVSSEMPAAERETPASPRARRAAVLHAVDLATLSPTGKGGRIRERDVLSASASLSSPDSPVGEPPTGMRRLAISPARRTIAARLMHSRQTTVPVTITARCEASRLVRLRQWYKAEGAAGRLPVVPTLNDLLVKLAATALRDHPLLAATWTDDAILVPEVLHIGIAVDTDDGLRVPVIRDAWGSSLAQVAEQSRRLVAAAREGRLSSGDTRGGCFTISNLGAFGVGAFTPVLNPPESAILGVGAVEQEVRPVDGGGFEACERLTLSLTFDHRVVDGAPAARFLQTLCRRIEEISDPLHPNPSHP